MDKLRDQVWQIPRNFLELTHEVIGRGKFGSVVKAKVNKRGAEEVAIAQVVPGKLDCLTKHAFKLCALSFMLISFNPTN